MSEHSQYNDYVEQYEAAYLAHRTTYELRNPKPDAVDFPEAQPLPPGWKLENAGTLLMLGISVGSSMIVSGSRTIPEFGAVGVPAFAMLEMGLITYAFIRTSRNYSAEKHETVTKWVSRGMGMAFVVLLAANIDNVLASQGIRVPAEVDLIIDLLVAVSAPVLALISGDVLGMYSVMQRQSRKKDEADYKVDLTKWQERRDAFEVAQRVQLDDWREGLNASWNAAKKQMGVALPSRQLPDADRQALPPSAPSGVSVRSDADSLQTRPASYGYNTSADGQQTVIKWLNEHPDDAKLGSRPLGKLIGVSHDTANKGRQEWQRQRQLAAVAPTNGHAPSEEQS